MGDKAYYNEIDPATAQWLRNLIEEGYIAPGEVDERSIEDVRPADLAGFTQCHFFAGIGVWSHALRQAGWPDSKPVWTGSCPCQPFSSAGKAAGFADERHLWPHFHYLIQQCRPPVVFGEQVASKDGLSWLDLVQADLEASNYSSGAADLAAAGVGAPHIRQRLYWVAHDNRLRLEQDAGEGSPGQGHHPESCRGDGIWMGYPLGSGLEGHSGDVYDRDQPRRFDQAEDRPTPTPSCPDGFWSRAQWLSFRDGKVRPIEPGTVPLAYRTPSTLVRLRAYGNAIVGPLATEFIRAYMDVVNADS